MCERCLELEEQVRQLKELLKPEKGFPARYGLTPRQTELLSVLATRPMVSRDSAMTLLYSDRAEVPNEKIIDAFIFQLRQKVDFPIITQWGAGWYIPASHRPQVVAMMRSVE